MQMDEEKMEDMEFDILTEIGNIGAGNATTALAKLINERIDMHVPKVEMLAFRDLAEIIGGAETLVAGILLSLEGDIECSMLFVLENNAAHHLVHKLMGTEITNVAGSFTEMELSALLEIGNIISGAYLTAISQLTNLSIIQTVQAKSSIKLILYLVLTPSDLINNICKAVQILLSNLILQFSFLYFRNQHPHNKNTNCNINIFSNR